MENVTESTQQLLDSLEPGAFLRLTSSTGHTAVMLAEPQPQKRFGYLLALPASPYHRLTVSTQRQPPDVHFKHSKERPVSSVAASTLQEPKERPSQLGSC